MAYIPGPNGGRINVSLSGANTAGALAAISSGTLYLAGGNNVTLSQNANSITVSANGLTSQSNQNVTAANGGFAFQTLSFSNANGFSFGTSAGSAITGSYTVPTQTNQTLSQVVTGNTVGNVSSMTVDARSLTLQGLGNASVGISTSAGGSSLIVSGSQSAQTQSNIQAVYDGTNSISTGTIRYSNSNGISFGINGQTLTASHNGITSQTNQNLSLYVTGNSTHNSSSVLNANSLLFNGIGGASLGYSNGSIELSVPGSSSLSATGAFSISTNGGTISMGVPAYSAGISNGIGSTSGTTGFATNQLVLAGGNNITLSQSTAAGGNTLTISAASQTIQTQNLMTVNGTQGNVTISAGANITVGNNASTITISGPAMFDAGASNTVAGGTTNGNMATSLTGGLAFYAGSNIGLSQATAAGGNGSITIYGANGGGGGGGGVNIAASNTTFTSGTVVMSNNGGALTIGSAAQSVLFSVPATSQLTYTGAVSIATAGNVISIGAPQNGTIGNWEPMVIGHMGALSTRTVANSSMYFYKLQPQAYVSATQLQILMGLSLSSSSNNSHAAAFTVGAGIYVSTTGSSMTLLTQSTGSYAYQYTNTSNNSYGSLTGIRGITMAMNAVMTPGNYWLGIWQRVSTTNANWVTLGYIVPAFAASSYMGAFGGGAASSVGIQEGVGAYSAASATFVSSPAMNAISQSHLSLAAMPHVAFKNITW